MSNELIETESTDKKLKYIVTEKNIYSWYNIMVMKIFVNGDFYDIRENWI
jgi:hypothetical protein